MRHAASFHSPEAPLSEHHTARLRPCLGPRQQEEEESDDDQEDSDDDELLMLLDDMREAHRRLTECFSFHPDFESMIYDERGRVMKEDLDY